MQGKFFARGSANVIRDKIKKMATHERSQISFMMQKYLTDCMYEPDVTHAKAAFANFFSHKYNVENVIKALQEPALPEAKLCLWGIPKGLKRISGKNEISLEKEIETAVRECSEETNLRCNIDYRIASNNERYIYSFTDDMMVYNTAAYIATTISKTNLDTIIRPENGLQRCEIEAAAWVLRKDLPQYTDGPHLTFLRGLFDSYKTLQPIDREMRQIIAA